MPLMAEAPRRILRTKLVGVSNYADAVSRMCPGDEVEVAHEPGNEYDANAFRVAEIPSGQTIGYLARDVSKRVIEKDAERAFRARVTDVTAHEGATVGGYVEFETDAGYLTPAKGTNQREEESMSKYRIDDEITSQGAEGWESGRSSRVRPFKLPAGQPITIIPLTDYTTGAADGGWLSFREVKAFGGVRIGDETVDLPGRLITFPARDFVIVTGRDGTKKRQHAADPLLERIAPSRFEMKRPRNAPDDWQPPRHARPKDVTYLNCVFIEGKLEEGDRAKYNPKSGDHIILSMATTWYEDWKRLMDRDRKKERDYSPAGRRWTLKITGSFDAGNLALEADDELGEPIPLPDVINLDDYVDSIRDEVDAWVAALDGVVGATFDDSAPEVEESEIRDAEDASVDSFEAAVDAAADASQRDWTEEVPARLRKWLKEAGVAMKPIAKADEIYALAAENDLALRTYLDGKDGQAA